MAGYAIDNLKKLSPDHLRVLQRFWAEQTAEYEALWREASRLITLHDMGLDEILCSETSIITEETN